MTVTIKNAPSRRSRAKAAPKVSDVEITRHMLAASRLQAQVQELEKQLLAEREWLLNALKVNNKPSFQLGDFHAYKRSRHNWTYSAHLERELLKIRNDQKVEQSEGMATDNPTVYVSLMFRQPKD